MNNSIDLEEKHYWTTSNGDEIDITEMTTSHIQNAIRYLERKAEAGAVTIGVIWSYDGDTDSQTPEEEWMDGKEWLAECEEYDWLKEELERRQNDTRNNIKRAFD